MQHAAGRSLLQRRPEEAGGVEAPDDLEPFEVLLWAFRKSARNLENNRPFSEPRLQIIAVTPALRERELAKHASLTDAVAEALRQRGVADGLATLAARTGWAAYHHAVQAWIDDPAQRLSRPSTLAPQVGRVDITKVTRMRDVYLRFTSGQSGDFFNLYGFDFGH